VRRFEAEGGKQQMRLQPPFQGMFQLSPRG
jgi:hypothetical protein